MLIGLGVRDVVLIERLDLAFGPGLTALTGETGAGKSILLDALGLAAGRRADAGLVRRGADQATASAIFAPGPGHAVWSILEEKGLGCAPDEDLVLRRTLSADGRSRAFVNDQPATVAVLRELSALLLVDAIQAAGGALSELAEAEAAVDAAASAFDVEPDRLDKVEERLFALRAAARRLRVPAGALPAARAG